MKYYKSAIGERYPKLSKRQICGEIDALKRAQVKVAGCLRALAREMGYYFGEEFRQRREGGWYPVVKKIKPTATEANKKKRK